jgi:hypothetical protein
MPAGVGLGQTIADRYAVAAASYSHARLVLEEKHLVGVLAVEGAQSDRVRSVASRLYWKSTRPWSIAWSVALRGGGVALP